MAPWSVGQPYAFTLAGAVCMLLFIFSALIGVQSRNVIRRSPRGIEGLQGTARWITTKSELQDIGFLPRDNAVSNGVYVGGWTDPKSKEVLYLRHDGPEHIVAIAPTRSGKGVGLVLPTLLSYPHSCLVNDLKGELWGQTAGWRAMHGNNIVIKFDPASAEGSASFNPLDEIRVSSINAIGDTQNIVTMIVDPDGKGLNDHWAKTSHALLTGLILHILHKEWLQRDLVEIEESRAVVENTTLYKIAFALSDPSRSVNDLYEEMIQTAPYQPTPPAVLEALEPSKRTAARERDDRRKANDAARQAVQDRRVRHNEAKRQLAESNGYIHDLEQVLRDAQAVTAAAGRDMLNRPDNERGSVLSTAMSFLSLYRDPLVRKNTSRSDFSINDLMNNERPVTLYLVVRPSDKDRLRPLVRLLLNQVVRNLTRDNLAQLPDGRFVSPHKRPLLLMLDEFAGSFGNMAIFEESLAFLAGYGIRAYIILQDREQLLKAYGQNENIISNTHIRIAYAPNQTQTAQWLSDMLGTTTILKEEVSESGERGGMLGHINRSFREIKRPLMTADEIMHMKAPRKDSASGAITHRGDMLIFGAGQPAIYGTQILYFTDPTFLARAQLPAPETMATTPMRTPAISRFSPKPTASTPAPAPAQAPEPKPAEATP
ncbi:MAG: type IV secretory system conjugative DNA transfer family protein [Terracidiphilus sp.]|nr:type IV secretory system conjugative DNA transfer family protein [Terracidiphilus sp.]